MLRKQITRTFHNILTWWQKKWVSFNLLWNATMMMMMSLQFRQNKYHLLLAKDIPLRILCDFCIMTCFHVFVIYIAHRIKKYPFQCFPINVAILIRWMIEFSWIDDSTNEKRKFYRISNASVESVGVFTKFINLQDFRVASFFFQFLRIANLY